jgi:RNA polymerase sigma factor (sigma-70 family)
VHRSDPELVRACREGSQAAWNELVERYGRLVYSIPKRYGLSDADADDVFASVWAMVFRKLDDLRDQTRLSAWVITTTHRECWRIGKKQIGKHAQLDHRIADLGSPSDQQMATWEQQQLVRQSLEQLGGRCQELLSALFLDPGEASYEAISKRLGMTLGSIGPTRARCFKKLEKIMVELGLDEPDVRSAAGSQRKMELRSGADLDS